MKALPAASIFPGGIRINSRLMSYRTLRHTFIESRARIRLNIDVYAMQASRGLGPLKRWRRSCLENSSNPVSNIQQSLLTGSYEFHSRKVPFHDTKDPPKTLPHAPFSHLRGGNPDKASGAPCTAPSWKIHPRLLQGSFTE